MSASFLNTEKQLGNPIHLHTDTLWIGPVPVVLTLVLTFQVGSEGSVHVGVSAGVQQELNATYGLKYANQAWSPVTDFSNTYTYTPPTIDAGLDLKGYASARLSVLAYGLAGMDAALEAYLKLEADPCANPWWQLYGGLRAPVGVRVDLFGYKTIVNKELVAIDKRIWLAAASGGLLNCNAGLVPAGPFKMGCERIARSLVLS